MGFTIPDAVWSLGSESRDKRMKLSCVSSVSTSQTGQTDMAEMAETLGVEALTNALTPGEQQLSRLWLQFKPYKNLNGVQCWHFYWWREICLSFREGGRDWDSSRKMDGDRPWQSMDTFALFCVCTACYTDWFGDTMMYILSYSSFVFWRLDWQMTQIW